MMTAKGSGALVSGASLSEKAPMPQQFKAKVIRGVYIRGTPYAEGAIVQLNAQEMGELTTANYVVKAKPEDEPPEAAAEKPKAK